MLKIAHLFAAAAVIGASFVSLSAPVSAQTYVTEQAARAQAARAQQIKAAKIAKMKMAQARRAQAAQASMAMATVTAATIAATDAGECSPYLAKWMMTRHPAWKVAYDACMDD